MDMEENESDGSRQIEPTHIPIICGLPDDIALFCLARVPRTYHALLKCVSKRWRELVCSEEWCAYRRKHELEETWIYALCRNNKSKQLCCYVLDPSPSCRRWKPIHGFPPQCLKRIGMACEVLGKNVYLLGGCDAVDDVKDEVYCYDASKGAWDKAAPMSTARCHFACEALNEKIYAIGGVLVNSSDPRSWDTYDPCTNSWTSRYDPNIVHDIDESVVVDGKIYVNYGSSGRHLEEVDSVVFEPSSGTWQVADKEMVSGWFGPAIVVDGTLYVLDQQNSGTKLMMWQNETREWVAVGRLSTLLTRPLCKLAAIGKSLFIIGKGLSTVVIDLGKARNLGGVMVTSSIPKLVSDDVVVISCKVLSI